ncbi:MAG: hypothetical protein AB8I08_12855 [Sandaracinaceae bacterium]
MQRVLALASFLCLACSGPPATLRPDSGPTPDSGEREPDAGPDGPTALTGGALTEDVCGVVIVSGSIEVPEGATVTVCAGSTITFDRDVALTVAGTLRLAGTADERIQLSSEARWDGIVVSGTLESDFTDIYDAELALEGLAGSLVRFDDGTISARATRSARLANGGTFDRTRIIGGSTFRVTGGTLRMTDSEIDLDHATESPDCTSVSGAGMVLDHTRFTNCHCPIHINSIEGELTITNSVFDGASYPVMIARASGTFSNNVFEGIRAQLQDIGGSIDVDLAGNYYVGDADILDTDDPSQFRNVDDALSERPAGVGPR